MNARNLLLASGILVALLGLPTPRAAAQLGTDVILATDPNATTATGPGHGQGTVFEVDPRTGHFDTLVDLGSNSPAGAFLSGIAMKGKSTIFVADENAGTNQQGGLFQLRADTGDVLLIEDFGNGAAQGETPRAVAVQADGTVLVLDRGDPTHHAVLFKVDPASADRSVLTDLSAGSNPVVVPLGMTLAPDGTILIADSEAGTNQQGALFKVDPVTGARTVLSDFGVGANPGQDPRAVAVQTDGSILVLDRTGTGASLFKVDPSTGARTVLSDFGGAVLFPNDLALASDGSILVLVQAQIGVGNILKVDPDSGHYSVLTDFGKGTPVGPSPQHLAVVGFPLPPACRRFPSRIDPPLFSVPKLGAGAIACNTICTALADGCSVVAQASAQCITDGLGTQTTLLRAACSRPGAPSGCRATVKKLKKKRASFLDADLAIAQGACDTNVKQDCLDRCSN